MKHSQLLLKFSRSIMRSLQLVPDTVREVSAPKRPGLRHEPLLEEVSRQLLRAAGCRGLKVGVCWNSRLRTTAGLACWRRKTISLNPRLMEISQEEVQRTLRHELAHFLAQHRAGRKRIPAHGEEWRQACRDLGIPNEPRCHDLPFKRTRMERRFFYSCRGCGAQLGRVRPIKKRVACLKCCRRHNEGRYHESFRFVQAPPSEQLAA